MSCFPVDNGSYDPIVYPGQNNVGHAHTFCGSEAVSPTVTREEQMAAPSSIEFSDGLAHGNHSIYWVPQLMTRDGEMVGMIKANLYYRSRNVADAHQIKPFPEGLKLITRLQDGMVWYCSSLHSGSNGDERAKPYDCKGKYRYVSAEIRFPQCGDGRLDSADHTSHFAEPVAGECPTTHPFAFPSVKFKVKYDTSLGTEALLADGTDPDTQFHADLMEGWEQESINHLLEQSIYKGIFIENHYPESTVPEPTVDEPRVEAPTTPTLTTDATDTATLPDGTISDVATLSDATNDATGTITFSAYGPFDPATDPTTDVCDETTLAYESPDPVDIGSPDATSGNYVVSSDDPAVTTDDFVPTEAGRYQWVASYSGDDTHEPVTSECNAENEQSVVSGEEATTGTEQNMTLAGEIGEDANSADPATDTTDIEGTTQNDNTTLGTDSEDDVLYGDSSANKLLGRHGNDYLDGGRGRDRMVGGKQDDHINGAEGKPGDVINGGIGTDYCVGDVGDEIKNCDGNEVYVPLPSKSAAPVKAGH